MTESRSLFVFCNKCQENIPIEVTQADLDASTSGIVTVLSVHGDPQHATLVYVDKNLRIRAVEYPSTLEIEKTTTTTVESTKTSFKQEHLSFSSLVDLFGKKRKNAILVFSRIVAQILMKGSVYIVHDDPSTALTVIERLQDFFSTEAGIFSTTHDQVKELNPSACVYSIQVDKFMSEGNTTKTKVLEKLVKESLDDESSFFRFKLDLSKLIFAYTKVKQILIEEKGNIEDIKLAKMAMIELANIPFLLELAESEGINISNIQYNGLGRVARGF
ncbi:MAG: hypothetical protein ACTSV2_14035 [Candidatus Thorarchaeota archaeon]